jgi:hypothetical protein
VPPGSGILNIIIKNEKAAQMPKRGIFFLLNSSFTLAAEFFQIGSIVAPNTAQVDGLRKLSGICMFLPLKLNEKNKKVEHSNSTFVVNIIKILKIKQTGNPRDSNTIITFFAF